MAFSKLLRGLLFAFLLATTVFGQGFSVANIDRTTDPCSDFYQYACGTWLAQNPVPADQEGWGLGSLTGMQNKTMLRTILEKASVNTPKRDAITQRLGDYYYACMDEGALEKRGLGAILPELRTIASVSAKSALLNEIVSLHRRGIHVFFAVDVLPDNKNSRINMAQLNQDGLGLPDASYYLDSDERFVNARRQYITYLGRVFVLMGEEDSLARAHAGMVMAVETDLAKGQLKRTELRDPQQVYHKVAVQELSSMAPFLDWHRYFRAMGAPEFDSLNVRSPAYLRHLQLVIAQHDLQDLITYLRWRLVGTYSRQLLSSAFDQEGFRFYAQTLFGIQQLQPRWMSCLGYVSDDLGDALGQKFVEATFGAEGKTRTLRMVEEVEKAIRSDIQQLDWMSAATKREALHKLTSLHNKIGYPDTWRDYSSVHIRRDDALGNNQRATEFEVTRKMKKIGRPVDPGEWDMGPQVMNAYYDPYQNSVNFPAGILQPPYFDKDLDDAVNYGALGSVVGHEIAHGFDDEGRQFDAEGNLQDWWTAQDAEQFRRRAQCFIEEYQRLEPVPGVHFNGALMLGENTADNAGIRFAFMGLMDSLNGRPPVKIEGFTSEQRFFLGFAQRNCANTREQTIRAEASNATHAPDKLRVNAVVSNMAEFSQAFACKVSDAMVSKDACRVW